MLKIHVLNVHLGDSIVLETEVQGESYYSLIDCKHVDGKAPTVEFLKQKHIRHIQSLFLTHLHNDHYSGFPELLDYLQNVRGTLEYFVCPQLPAEVHLWRQIITMAHDQITKDQLTACLKAMNGFLNLPSLTHQRRKPMAVRIVYEGRTGNLSWQDHLHPALLFAPVNPSAEEALRWLQSAFKSAQVHNKAVNALSHCLLIAHDHGSRRDIALFTGDLDGKSWRFIKNRCLEITSGSIRNQFVFFKAPHHGAYSPGVENCLQELVDPNKEFVASISSPPGDPKHPDARTLSFFKNTFPASSIACTNISAHCYAQGFPSIVKDLLEQSPKEAEFLEFASISQADSSPHAMPGACAGDHVLAITEDNCHLQRATNLPCSFKPLPIEFPHRST
jgi:hypothetical protein